MGSETLELTVKKKKMKMRAPSWSEFWVMKKKKPHSNNTNKQAAAINNIMQQLVGAEEEVVVVEPPWTQNMNMNININNALTDDLLLKIFSMLPDSQRNSNYSLVCKRWLYLQGRLFRSLTLFHWDFLLSGRLISRFPNLTRLDLIPASSSSSSFPTPNTSRPSVLFTHRLLSFSLPYHHCSSPANLLLLPPHVVDQGLRALASCPNLRTLSVFGPTEMGLLSVAEECPTLQHLELHRCSDNLLRGIAACRNLQILKLVGANLHDDDGFGFFYDDASSAVVAVSDVGLTILAQGCKRLVKLELSGCEGGFDGIKAIGQCCLMLEELTLSRHRMEPGWLPALSYCDNLKTLNFLSCRTIDPCPGPDQYLSLCPPLHRLLLHNCQLRDKKSARALFKVCQAVREIHVHNCWGLDDNVFSFASVCRQVKSLSLKGCSLLTTQGLESAILGWNELQSLRIESCKNIKDGEVSPALSTIFSVLKELKWRTDAKSLLASSLAGTGMGKKGGRFFRRSRGLKFLPDD
ncbi:hypothetical protein Tsubulata_038911 [Turnera subulata]|uniref:F-box domain-containing protein n=1 Tax=Turnera subulata TaxID=218843 RepID=A0A9Q0GBR0_9ROSI|nr:hypothetical protein Tsubulata_038911 [Turnera subulata]